MKPRSAIRLWHEVKEHCKELGKRASYEELHLIDKCVFYFYDSGACEEDCNHPEMQYVIEKEVRAKGIDFNACDWCWKCQYREVKT